MYNKQKITNSCKDLHVDCQVPYFMISFRNHFSSSATYYNLLYTTMERAEQSWLTTHKSMCSTSTSISNTLPQYFLF